MSLPFMCSSYTAEAFAVKSALQLMLLQSAYRKRDIVIFSDCKSVLQSISNNHLNVHKNPYVTEARLLLYELIHDHGKRVILIWIPAHVGITGNELADELAKEAACEEADPSIVVPVGDMMMRVRRETWESTQRTIVAESAYKGTFYFKNFHDQRSTKPWFWGLNKERYFVTFINRLRANHFNLGSSLYRKGYVDSERCDCGYEIEDLQHVLLQCRRYDDLRIDMDAELRAVGFLAHIDIFNLIRRQNWKILHIIVKFF
ncbi:uncharacterized protein [Temnothorax nylanderi]|uniref:uncharacterized protein n=1 Tax=Temnothorax nylanderi TaxID=102681 RepID=UPI003A842F27